jgi:DNA-binding beta-propeller fold protein YncE
MNQTRKIAVIKGGSLALFAFASTTLLLALSLVSAPARAAEHPSLLYATAEAGNKLVAFSLEAKRVRAIGDTGFPLSVPLAFCPPGGRPYTITNTFNPAKAQLATLNLDTGAATLVGSPLGQALTIMGMTCSPDGTLYAIGQFDSSNPDFNSLYTVDRGTGFALRIGPTGVQDQGSPYGGFLMALAFAPDGTLYGANVSTLFRVDPSTGEATKIVDFVGVTSVMGLAIDNHGNFYVSEWVAAPSSIYGLNVATGVATPILNTGLPLVHNIAFKAP